jgi:hypothetical protein
MGINSEAESREYLLGVCPSCGWWATLQNFTAHYIPGYDSDAGFLDYCNSVHQSFAILESFNVAEDEAPLGEIAEVLERDWSYSTQISAKKAQDLVLSVFKNYMACDVFYYDNSVYAPDGGIDFVLVRSERRKVAFQVKRRQTAHPEGVRAVREFIGALANSPYDEGFFVTTAPLSFYATKELAGGEVHRDAKNIEVTVVDGSKLREIMALHRPTTKSEAALMSILPETGWHSARLGLSGVHVKDIPDIVKKSAAK